MSSTKPSTIKRQQSISTKSTGKYWEKLKNVEVQQISQYKSKETNLKMRHYWNDVIREMERLAMQQAEQSKIKINDLSTSLPPKLYKRISKIIPLSPIEDDTFEDEFEDKSKSVTSDEGIGIQPLKLWDNKSFNESTCTIINEEQRIYKDIDIQISEIPKSRKQKKTLKNWQSEYLCQKQKDRIKWNSKLYQLKTDIWEKPLYEQAEELMDNSADCFLDWLNNLSKLSETNMTKDVLKSLFSLEVNTLLAGGVKIEPKILGAVPAQVAHTWNMPDKSISLKLAQNLKAINENIPKNVKTHAFGRTIPHYMRPWIPQDSYNIIKPDIPEDLRKCKILFQGITHLRATKKFIEHCQENPDIEKPEYLKESGCFNEEKEAEESKIPEAPLCELLQLQT